MIQNDFNVKPALNIIFRTGPNSEGDDFSDEELLAIEKDIPQLESTRIFRGIIKIKNQRICLCCGKFISLEALKCPKCKSENNSFIGRMVCSDSCSIPSSGSTCTDCGAKTKFDIIFNSQKMTYKQKLRHFCNFSVYDNIAYNSIEKGLENSIPFIYKKVFPIEKFRHKSIISKVFSWMSNNDQTESLIEEFIGDRMFMQGKETELFFSTVLFERAEWVFNNYFDDYRDEYSSEKRRELIEKIKEYYATWWNPYWFQSYNNNPSNYQLTISPSTIER